MDWIHYYKLYYKFDNSVYHWNIKVENTTLEEYLSCNDFISIRHAGREDVMLNKNMIVMYRELSEEEVKNDR